jgi:glucose-1-phosphate adenylyltransferase
MGADFVQTHAEIDADSKSGTPALGIGAGSHIEGAIIDKNCRIGKNVKISPAGYREAPSGAPVVIEEGVLVVPKETTLADGWKLPAR